MKKIYIFFIFVLLFSAVKAQELPVYKDSSKPVEERIGDLVKRMTVDEKIGMIAGVSGNSTPDTHAKMDDPNTIIQALDFLSKTLRNVRLGIPELIMTDGPLGPKGKGGSTNYSAAVNFAATFDPDLIKKVGQSMGAETRNLGFNVLLGPCINISRSPFNGRSFESFGEDPYLTSVLSVAFVKGVQSQRVVSCPKHYAVNNQEWNRMTVDVDVNERALREIYLPAFKATVQEADAWFVMSSYNKFRGEWCGENGYLLTDILKNEFKFTGAVISDWGGTHNTLPALRGGLDLEMPIAKVFKKELVVAELKKGTITEDVIDDKVKHLLRVMFEAGLFDESVGTYGGQANTEYRRNLALEVAEKSIVLLKNKGKLLPVDTSKVKKIAVIGPYGNVARMTGSGSADNEGHYGVSIFEGVKNVYGQCSDVYYKRGIAQSKENLPVLSDSLLLLPEGKGDEHGVWAEYFNNRDLKGAPVLTRIEGAINFDWGYGSSTDNSKKQWSWSDGMPEDNKGGSPDINIVRPDEWSARWTGRLKSPGDGWYNIGLKADNGARIYINDKVVIDSWTSQIPGVYNITQFKFEKGKVYDLKVEFFENWGSSSCILGLEKFKPGSITDEAVQLASESDIVISAFGSSKLKEGEGTDKSSLAIDRAQIDLIKRVAKVNKNIVVVLYGGNPFVMEDWKDDVPVIIEAFYPGQEGGNAIANIINGKVNPSGKLPVTFPVKWEDSPAYGSYPGERQHAEYTEGIFVGYRGYDKNNIEPHFPFGYGLSYTTFKYTNLKLSSEKISKDDELIVSVTVTNTGAVDGDEIVQLYMSDLKSSVEREMKVLKGFKRVMLKAGESKTVSFKIDKDALSFYNVKSKSWIAESGKFEVLIGASSRDIRLQKSFILTKK